MTASQPKKPAVFLDRDGTLMEEVNYCRHPDDVVVYAGVSESLQSLREAGFRTVLVTNQSGIGRGIISIQEYGEVHARFVELLGSDLLDASYMCPDTPDTPSLRRKPAPGMLLEAAQELDLDLSRSWLIGDKDIDIRCAMNANVPGVLVRTGHGSSATGEGAAHVAADFAAAVRWILGQLAP